MEAIHRLDVMSGSPAWGGFGPGDFDRFEALGAIQPLLGSRSVTISTTATAVFGRDSPYLDDQDAPFWFAGIGNQVSSRARGPRALWPRSAPKSCSKSLPTAQHRSFVRSLSEPSVAPRILLAPRWFPHGCAGDRIFARPASPSAPQQATPRSSGQHTRRRRTESGLVSARASRGSDEGKHCVGISTGIRQCACAKRSQPYLAMLAEVIEQQPNIS